MMQRGMKGAALAAALLGVLSRAPAGAADVHIGINVGVPPPPPVVIEAPPPLVVVPRSPVYYAPQLPYNYFYFGGRYYTFHDGAWFSAVSFGGPWGFISIGHVPPPILAVPVRYYNVPPRHWREYRGRPRWDRHDDHDGHDHHHGRGHGKHDD